MVDVFSPAERAALYGSSRAAAMSEPSGPTPSPRTRWHGFLEPLTTRRRWASCSHGTSL
jgi:hypothetical protein